MGQRRRAREAALQCLYQIDVQPDLRADVALARFFANFTAAETNSVDGEGGADLPVYAPEVKSHVERLVHGVATNLAAIDARIGRASRNWRLERMARVDRNLLRLAVYEMAFAGDVPGKVAINEAIEVAKRFGAQETPAFVNGILDRVLADRGGGGSGGGEPEPSS